MSFPPTILCVELNDEVHARPPEALVAPVRVSFLALFSDSSRRETQWGQVRDLAGRFGAAPPKPGANYYSADLGPFRLKWERHTEFVRYKFIVAGAGDDPFAEPAITAVPGEWVAALPGRSWSRLMRRSCPPAESPSNRMPFRPASSPATP